MEIRRCYACGGHGLEPGASPATHCKACTGGLVIVVPPPPDPRLERVRRVAHEAAESLIARRGQLNGR